MISSVEFSRSCAMSDEAFFFSSYLIFCYLFFFSIMKDYKSVGDKSDPWCGTLACSPTKLTINLVQTNTFCRVCIKPEEQRTVFHQTYLCFGFKFLFFPSPTALLHRAPSYDFRRGLQRLKWQCLSKMSKISSRPRLWILSSLKTLEVTLIKKLV